MASFGTAESECLISWPDWTHQGHLFFSTSRQVLERVSSLVVEKMSRDSYWLGIDDRDKDGEWVDRYAYLNHSRTTSSGMRDRRNLLNDIGLGLGLVYVQNRGENVLHTF